jgi:hypothetical protein
MISCSAQEIATPSKLYIDARTFPTFADIPNTIPRVSTADYADIDPKSFAFTPGGPDTINMLRAELEAARNDTAQSLASQIAASARDQDALQNQIKELRLMLETRS